MSSLNICTRGTSFGNNPPHWLQADPKLKSLTGILRWTFLLYVIKCKYWSPLAHFSVEELKILCSPHRSNPEHSKCKFLIVFWSFTVIIKIYLLYMGSYEDSKCKFLIVFWSFTVIIKIYLLYMGSYEDYFRFEKKNCQFHGWDTEEIVAL